MPQEYGARILCVDSCGQQDAAGNDADNHVGSEEGQKRGALVGGNVLAVHLQREHGVGVNHLRELVADVFHQYHHAYGLDAAAGGAGAGSDKHADAEDDPRGVGPRRGVFVEQAGAGEERNHLEESCPQGVLSIIVALDEENGRHCQRAAHYHPEVQPELGIVEEDTRTPF